MEAPIMANLATITPSHRAAPPAGGVVTGQPRRWLRLEGAAALAAGVGLYLQSGGHGLALLPLLLLVDVSMLGYLASPRIGAFTYNLAHNWALGIVVLGSGVALGAAPLELAGAVLLAHVGLDRLAGYGLKYPTSFGDTHLGHIGR
jgi:hypothetical protein